jgi:monoamine oxidase
MGVFVEKMLEHVPRQNIKNNMRVTSLAPVPGTSDVKVTCAYSASPEPVTYNHVISTIPLSCLRIVDMSAYSADWKVSTALRTLTYGPSTKVGIRFASRWWENLETLSTTGAKNQLGGVTTTDRPTRVVVYPSYGIGTNTGATMIVSYTWSQDALRLGSLCGGTGTTQEEALKGLILQDLAVIHGVDQKWLAGQVRDFDAWAWYNYDNAAGAYAFFNPGQFSDLYAQVTQPMLGSLHFAGEATSIHHAWVVGSINSAYRTLVEVGMHEKNELILDELPKLWPDIKEFDMDVIRQQVALGQNR